MKEDKIAVNGALLYRRLLSYVWPYKGIFLISVLGMAVVALAEVAFAALLNPSWMAALLSGIKRLSA